MIQSFMLTDKYEAVFRHKSRGGGSEQTIVPVDGIALVDDGPCDRDLRGFILEDGYLTILDRKFHSGFKGLRHREESKPKCCMCEDTFGFD